MLLKSLPEDSARSMLLISDGDFDESDLVPRIEKLAQEGIKLHVLGVGTEEGALVPAPQGGWVTDRSGNPIRSALNEDLLKELARAGQASYQEASFRDDDTEEVLEAATVTRLPPEAGDERTRIWNERFYIPVLALAALLLPQFRGRARPRRRAP